MKTISPRNSQTRITAADSIRMRDLVAFTMRAGKTAGRTPFGSVVVKTATGQPVVRRVNRGSQFTDPTLHAEVFAVRVACKQVRDCSLRGYSLYTTCEPCPMCMAACLWADLDRVVFGATIEDASRFCRQIYISAREVNRRSDLKCEVIGPVERQACFELFQRSGMERK